MASNLEEANKKFLKKILRSFFDPIYTQEFKLPKYNGRVTVMNGPASTILARSGKFDKMEHLKRADLFARAAVAAEKKYSKALNDASMETFGRPYEFTDYKISGIARDEYSEKRKDQLRTLAHSISIFKTLSRAHEDAAKIQNRYKLTYASNPKRTPKKPFDGNFGTGYIGNPPRGKMKPEHFQHIKDGIIRADQSMMENHRQDYEKYKAAGHSHERRRWDLFWAAKFDRNFMNELYAYLNDSHIDTALKAITEPMFGKAKSNPPASSYCKATRSGKHERGSARDAQGTLKWTDYCIACGKKLKPNAKYKSNPQSSSRLVSIKSIPTGGYFKLPHDPDDSILEKKSDSTYKVITSNDSDVVGMSFKLMNARGGRVLKVYAVR